jgi:glycosyltransferase involved in cell wall biosynthesis
MSEAVQPKVSICIPTYRGAASIAATLDSVLSQSFSDFEVIVIDDRSTDNTVAIVAACRDPRVRYVVNDHNLGAVGNWNRCLELARAPYYKLLPHDDLLAPGSLQDQVAVLDADTEQRLALVFGWRQVIDAAGRPLMKRGLHGQPRGPVAAHDLMRRCIRAGTNLIGEPGSGLMRLSLAKSLVAYEPNNPYMVDLDFWFRALAHGDAFNTASCSSSFRISTTTWSFAIGRRQFADFSGFAHASAAVRAGVVSALDLKLGLVRARLNMFLRLLLYRFIR